MKKIRCYECGKSYDYHEDAFCPNCGSFNQPPRASRIAADGSIVRSDGINEANHQGSFVHQELHDEKRERRKYGLDKSFQRVVRPAARPTTAAGPAAQRTDSRSERKQWSLAAVVSWIVFAIIALNILSGLAWLF